MHRLPTKPVWLNRVSILGVGLLGGSVGMSLRRLGVHVVGYSRRESACQSAIDIGAIDEGFTEIESACTDSDVVVVAAPVDKIAALATSAGGVLPEHALITDVGSTKARIVAEIDALSICTAKMFVAAHPIAGSERTGVENASDTLFDGKLVILTPGPQTADDSLDRAIDFWKLTGGEVLVMSPQQHDEQLAAVSHVPHLISSLLASLLDDDSVPLVGSGWRDMTRVAAGDPAMWTAICQHNHDAIIAQLDRFTVALLQLRQRLTSQDALALEQWLAMAKSKKVNTLNQPDRSE